MFVRSLFLNLKLIKKSKSCFNKKNCFFINFTKKFDNLKMKCFFKKKEAFPFLLLPLKTCLLI